MPISKVYMICNAYESGVGHGAQDDDLPNPFENGTEEYEAYGYGVDSGKEICNET